MESKGQVRGSPGDELSLDSAGAKRPAEAKAQFGAANDFERRQHFTIEWRQLSYRQRPPTALNRLLGPRRPSQAGGEHAPRGLILNALDGRFKSGQLTAILGPSGAGKTTFLSCLFGSKQEQAWGRTRVRWQEEEEEEEPVKKRGRSIRSAMLAQQDHLLNHLSVYETLMFASKIKNAARRRHLDAHFHRRNVRRVARTLKLQDCLETRCGKLSGGQYKRVSIGQELLSEPDVIVLDEPTSGLDASTCLSTVQTLKSIVSGRPMSIVLTIHQPDQEVFGLFDHVYVIAQGGLTIYEGPPAGIAPTLELAGLRMPAPAYNPARFIVEQGFAAGAAGNAATSAADDAGWSSEEEEEEAEPKLKPRRSIKRPLLNIAIQTAEGKLVSQAGLEEAAAKPAVDDERLDRIRRLNQIQKSRYSHDQLLDDCSALSSAPSSAAGSPTNEADDCQEPRAKTGSLSAKSDYSGSSGWSSALSAAKRQPTAARSLQTMQTLSSVERESLGSTEEEEEEGFVVQFGASPEPPEPPRRQFDKRLSAKRNCRRRRQDQPVWHHALLLMHRTWLSIVRDPIFFGIQACMHTTIPFLLAAIFGSHQDEGCPRAAHFDLVEFAYAPDGPHSVMEQAMRSIRLSIGNIGVVFFEMFVLSFAINCITALVFPLDMHVLLKEHRNGWYSLRAYFVGRTLADLPVPLCLHSLAMAILCYMTGQPLEPTRFLLLLLLTNLASLVAQSVGLTIGAILMRSSQSAVLAAAGIVAPFFALSGFIVRIHTLPLVAQLAAQLSYLHHLLNGFILLRYGFGRCPCREQDLEPNQAHQVPANLRTLASLWVGTYANEFPHSPALANASGPGQDPNIDLVDKMVDTFRTANSYGHQIATCADLIPYAMLDFNLRDRDIYHCFLVIGLMLLLSRLLTFSAIYYKVRSFT